LKSFILIGIVFTMSLFGAENHLREGIVAYNAKSYDKAKFFFEEAISEDQSANAAYLLGKMYLNGEGMSVNNHKAIELFEFASEGGNIPAGCYLSEAYMNAKTNTSYIANGLIKGLKQKLPHCQKVLEQYFAYKF